MKGFNGVNKSILEEIQTALDANAVVFGYKMVECYGS